MMFMIRYSSKSLGQKIKKVAQRSASALWAEGFHPAGHRCSNWSCFNRWSRVTYWTRWFQGRWLMSRSQPSVPQIQLQVTGAGGRKLCERWFLRVQVWRRIRRKREHLSASSWALCTCDHLSGFGFLLGDISLTCTTSDLHNITCMWNRTRTIPENDYTLLYKQSLRSMLYH